MRENPHLRLAVVSTWPPKACGIAGFSQQLTEALLALDPQEASLDFKVIALADPADKLDYGNEVRVILQKEDLASLERAAAWINASGANVVSLQHEFGLWGGFDGQFVLRFLDLLRIPVVTTLHTVPFSTHAFDRVGRLRLLGEIIRRSAHLVTFLPIARDFIIEHFQCDPEKVAMQWHGAPAYPLLDRDHAKRLLGLSGHTVLSTLGLLTRFKGLDDALAAFQVLAADHPDLIYLVLGRPHPAEPESFYSGLRRRAEALGLADRIRFVDHYLTEDEVERYLAATDIYVTPYHDLSQISSGTLTRALAAGRLCVATPYAYAEAVLSRDVGVLAPAHSPAALAAALQPLVADSALRAAYEERARAFGRDLHWTQIAPQYAAIAARVALPDPAPADQPPTAGRLVS
jgi:glycosyltransferase involved in cell wall biosynthesis